MYNLYHYGENETNSCTGISTSCRPVWHTLNEYLFTNRDRQEYLHLLKEQGQHFGVHYIDDTHG